MICSFVAVYYGWCKMDFREILVLGDRTLHSVLRMIGKDILSLWPDESEETKKWKADFSMVLEVLRRVLG